MRSRRVLVVDDNRDAADSLAMLLRLTGTTSARPTTARRPCAAAEQFRPDVVLLDIGLPSMDGYEAARRIRGEPWGKEILLIAVTGWGQDDDRRQSARPASITTSSSRSTPAPSWKCRRPARGAGRRKAYMVRQFVSLRPAHAPGDAAHFASRPSRRSYRRRALLLQPNGRLSTKETPMKPKQPCTPLLLLAATFAIAACSPSDDRPAPRPPVPSDPQRPRFPVLPPEAARPKAPDGPPQRDSAATDPKVI